METFATKRSTKRSTNPKTPTNIQNVQTVQHTSYGIPFGGFTFGTGVYHGCSAGDTSFFCRTSRVFQIIMMIVFLAVIGIVIYAIFAGKNTYFGGSAFGGAIKSMRRSFL